VSTIDNFPGVNLTMTNQQGRALSIAKDLGSNTMEFTWVAPK
jgi:hypothetical protein